MIYSALEDDYSYITAKFIIIYPTVTIYSTIEYLTMVLSRIPCQVQVMVSGSNVAEVKYVSRHGWSRWQTGSTDAEMTFTNKSTKPHSMVTETARSSELISLFFVVILGILLLSNHLRRGLRQLSQALRYR